MINVLYPHTVFKITQSGIPNLHTVFGSNNKKELHAEKACGYNIVCLQEKSVPCLSKTEIKQSK